MAITRYLLCAATACAAFSTAAYAEDASDADSTILVTGLRAQTSLDIKSSGSRLGLSVFETPASIDAIDGDAIRARGDLSIQEAVSRATGITFQGSPGNGNTALASRGFGGQGSVQLLVDGTRLFVASGTLTFPVDPWTVERIDVLRGPSSVISGEGAIGGAINVIMKKPVTDGTVGQARLAYGSDNSAQIAADVGGGLGGGFSYRLAASATRSDGWLDRNSDSRNLAISGALRFDAASNLSFTLASDYGNVEIQPYFGTPLNNGQLDERFRFINFNIANSQNHFRDSWTRFNSEWQVSDAVTVRNVAYYLQSNRDYLNAENYRFNAGTGRVTRSDYLNIIHRQDQYGDRGDITIRTPLGDSLDNTLLVGFDVNRIKFRHINNSPYAGGLSVVDPFDFNPGSFLTTSPTIPGFRTLTTQYSVFAEDHLKIGDWLSLVGGFRQDWYDLKRIDQRIAANGFHNHYKGTSGRFGVVLNPTTDTSLYGSVTVGTDPIGTLITTSTAQRNFGLSPARQFEVGVKQRFLEGRGSASIALFDIEKRRLLTTDPETRITQQVGKRSSKGVEASLAFQINDAFGIEANGTILKARFKDFTEVLSGTAFDRAGNTPSGVPQKTANISANWRFVEPLQARVSARFVEGRWTDNANTLRVPGYEVVDAGLRWTISERLSLDGRVSNIFDKIYPIGSGTGQWLLGAPRRFDARLDISL
ncbi:MAG: TonB-dependent receptor [Sphingobium sp.]